MASMVRFLQISDTHWSFDPLSLPSCQQQIDTAKRFESLCKWIESLRDPIDFIVHTGIGCIEAMSLATPVIRRA